MKSEEILPRGLYELVSGVSDTKIICSQNFLNISYDSSLSSKNLHTNFNFSTTRATTRFFELFIESDVGLRIYSIAEKKHHEKTVMLSV